MNHLMNLVRGLVLIALWLAGPQLASAVNINLYAQMDGAQANAGAGSGSPGTGEAFLILDTQANELQWEISWEGLIGDVTSAHIHGPATPDQDAGVQVPLDICCNPTAGSQVIDNLQQAALLDGLWYVNIHTDFAPGGEIRGQIGLQAVPLPAAAWLFLSAMLGLFAGKRARQQG